VNSPHSFLPNGSLPRLSFFPQCQSVEWLENTEDSREQYVKNGGHPIYGEHDIIYSFNSLGYRSIEFDTTADLRILAIGCSYVMGVGLAQRDLFHELFAERLKRETAKTVAVVNLGAPGASNDYIARVLHLAVPLLNPSIVLINFTHSGRREYVSIQSELLTYVPGYRPLNPVARDIYKHLSGLTSPLDDDLNLFRNYKSVEALLASRAWLFSSISATDFERISGHLVASRYVGAMPQLDKARDRCHPGPQSHRLLADSYWTSFVAAEYATGSWFGTPPNEQE
jgi:hypothetical protein